MSDPVAGAEEVVAYEDQEKQFGQAWEDPRRIPVADGFELRAARDGNDPHGPAGVTGSRGAVPRQDDENANREKYRPVIAVRNVTSLKLTGKPVGASWGSADSLKRSGRHTKNRPTNSGSPSHS